MGVIKKKKIEIEYPPLRRKPWVPPDLLPKPPRPKIEIEYPPLTRKTWIPPDLRPKKPRRKITIEYPPVPTRKWIPPDFRKKKPKPKPEHKKIKIYYKISPSTLQKHWNKFCVYGDVAILTGHFSQFHKRFTYLRRGYQGTCSCVLACVFAHVYNMSIWTSNHVDSILTMGDELYVKSLKQEKNTCYLEIPLENVFKSFFINNIKIVIDIGKLSKITKKISGKEDQFQSDWTEVLDEFFKKFPSGVISIERQHIAIWYLEPCYYLFTPQDCDEFGNKWAGFKGEGRAIVARFKNINVFVLALINLTNKFKNMVLTITPCLVDRAVLINVTPPETFEEIDYFKVKPVFSESNIEEADEGGTEKKESEKNEKENKNIAEEVEGEENEAQIKEDAEKLNLTLEEISPNIDDKFSISLRPSWLTNLPESKREPDKAKALPLKPKQQKKSYFTELKKNGCEIIRAGTSQTDPNFTKFMGSQSLGNAVSALIMLRSLKSKYWMQKTLNTILKYGDLLYRTVLDENEKGKIITINEFQTKLKMENNDFEIEVNEFAAIGKLQSQEDDVLDLFPTLETILTDNECCVIIGPVILAAWIENGLFYIFDPNERDKEGKVPRRSIQIGSSTVILDDVKGVACVVRFANLKDLVELYMENLGKTEKFEKFHISKIVVNEKISPPSNWGSFKGLKSGFWILRASISQNHFSYPTISRNFQSPSMSMMALAIMKIVNIEDWKIETINDVMISGDLLYRLSLRNLKKSGNFVGKMLLLSEIEKTYPFTNFEIHFQVDECIVNGIINAKDSNDVYNLKRGLQDFFINNTAGIVTSHNSSVAVWTKDGYYYYFDSHSRDEDGYATGFGTACVVRSMTLSPLASLIEANLAPLKQDYFNISRVSVELLDLSLGVALPPLNHYTLIDSCIAILRSTLSVKSPKFKRNCGKQIVPTCIIALGFNRLRPASVWSSSELDEIINKGDSLYVESVIEIDQQMKQFYEDEEYEGIGEDYDDEIMDLIALPPPPPLPEQEEPTPTMKGEDDDEEERELEEAEGEGEGIEKKVEEEILEEIKEDKTIKEEDPRYPHCKDVGVPQVTTENVKRNFVIGINSIEVEFEEIIEANIAHQLSETIEQIFDEESNENNNDNQEIILESSILTVALWRDQNVYYMFDPYPRDNMGQAIGKEDWSDYIPTPDDYEYLRGLWSGGEEGFEMNDDYRKLLPSEESRDRLTSNAVTESPSETEIDSETEQTGPSPLQPEIDKKTESFWLDQEKKDGAGNVMWFVKLNDLISYILEKMPPNLRRHCNFLLKKVKITNVPYVMDKFRPEDGRMENVFSGDWFEFKEIEYGFWILRGTLNINNELFPKENRGRQGIAACCAASACITLFPLNSFDTERLDEVIRYGDKLFSFVNRWKKMKLTNSEDTKLNSDEIDWFLSREPFAIEDMVKNICIAQYMIKMEITPEVVTGDINAQDFEEILDCNRGVEKFFRENGSKFGLLQAKDCIVAIWRGEKVYYMFDPYSRGPNGVKSLNGTACITRFLNLTQLVNIFLQNLNKPGVNSFFIHGIEMEIGSCKRKKAAVDPESSSARYPAVGGFHFTSAGKQILRGTKNIECEEFNKGVPYNISAPVAIVALTMTLIHKVDTWSKPIIDEILTLGSELYEESVEDLGFDFNPWEDIMDIYKVKNDYKVGVVKANFEIRNMDQRGIIDVKDSNKINLRQGIELFFEENSYGVIVTEPLTLAIWEETPLDEDKENLLYIFDPYPRGPLGLPLINGPACLMCFANANMASQHIISCILDPSKRNGPFSIIPIEIIVGKTKTKLKEIKSKVETNVNTLPKCSKLVACEKFKKLRKIAEAERRRKEAKQRYLMGRDSFYVLNDNEEILRGLRSQCSDRYCEDSRGNQDIPNCIVSLVMHKIASIDTWTHKDIDLILDTGDQLYIDSYISYGPKYKKLGMENVVRKFYMSDIEVHVTVYKPIISDLFTTNNVFRILTTFFQQEEFCMLSYEGQWITIIFKSGYYYIFDPHDRNIKGETTPNGIGWAVVLKIDNLNTLAERIVQNLVADNLSRTTQHFFVWLISVETK